MLAALCQDRERRIRRWPEVGMGIDTLPLRNRRQRAERGNYFPPGYKIRPNSYSLSTWLLNEDFFRPWGLWAMPAPGPLRGAEEVGDVSAQSDRLRHDRFDSGSLPCRPISLPGREPPGGENPSGRHLGAGLELAGQPPARRPFPEAASPAGEGRLRDQPQRARVIHRREPDRTSAPGYTRM